MYVVGGAPLSEAALSSAPTSPMDPVAPSVLSSWTRTIVDALEALGHDAEVVLVAAGFSRETFKDPNARLPATASARLWRAAAEHVGDPAFGLTVSKYVKQTTFHALGYAIFASATLRDALNRPVPASRGEVLRAIL